MAQLADEIAVIAGLPTRPELGFNDRLNFVESSTQASIEPSDPSGLGQGFGIERDHRRN